MPKGYPKIPGRRLKRTKANADRICELIIQRWSLRQIERELDCDNSTIIKWAWADPNGFGKQYARAMEMRAEDMSSEILEISDYSVNDFLKYELAAGAIQEIPDKELIARSRLRVDTRKWLMSKLMPKKFGDKMTIDQKLKVNNGYTKSDLEVAAGVSGEDIINSDDC
jgi:hypothetical protein